MNTITRVKPPERLFVQILRDGSIWAYGFDPREAHDNGKPVYTYIPEATHNVELIGKLVEALRLLMASHTDRDDQCEAVKRANAALEAVRKAGIE